jgi:quercetin dioxygenase-like cupin family protein
MATHHAAPGEVVDLANWAHDLPVEKTKIIVKTDQIQLARLVMPKGKEFLNHKISDPLVIQCIKGQIEFTAMGVTQEFRPGQLLYLMAEEPHSLKGIEDAVILLTIAFAK